MVICLTVLSLQQLLDAGHYRYRFSVLRKLGVEDPRISCLVWRQLGVWFGLPVGLAVLVSAVVVIYFIQTVSTEISAYIGSGRWRRRSRPRLGFWCCCSSAILSAHGFSSAGRLIREKYRGVNESFTDRICGGCYTENKDKNIVFQWGNGARNGKGEWTSMKNKREMTGSGKNRMGILCMAISLLAVMLTACGSGEKIYENDIIRATVTESNGQLGFVGANPLFNSSDARGSQEKSDRRGTLP